MTTENMKINQNLIWDYTFTEEEQQGEYFQKWYISRVLQRGGMEDIQNIGLPLIERHLSSLHLPRKIREFWSWVFEQRAQGHL